MWSGFDKAAFQPALACLEKLTMDLSAALETNEDTVEKKEAQKDELNWPFGKKKDEKKDGKSKSDKKKGSDRKHKAEHDQVKSKDKDKKKEKERKKKDKKGKRFGDGASSSSSNED